MAPHTTLNPWWYVAAMFACWGLTSFAFKYYSREEISQAALTAAHYALAALLFLPLTFLRSGPDAAAIGIGILGGLFNGVGIVLIRRALLRGSVRAYPTSRVVGLLGAVAVGAVAFHEPLTRDATMRVLLGVASVALLTDGFRFRELKNLRIALLAGAFSVFLMAALRYAIAEPFSVAWGFLAGSSLAAFAALATKARPVSWRHIRMSVWSSVCEVGGAASFVLAVRDLGLVTVAPISALTFIVAIVLSMIFQHERAPRHHLAGVAVACVALLV